MIPIGPISLLFIILFVFIPLIGGVLTLILFAKAVIFWLKHKKLSVQFFSKKIIYLSVITLICDICAVCVFYFFTSIEYEFELKSYYKEQRSHFILSQDYQYGELLVPKGSLISRNDAFDNGEPQLPVSLRGLKAIRFPHPVKVAGIWIIAMEPPRLELAQDQYVIPVGRSNTGTTINQHHSKHHKQQSLVTCSRGDLVVVDIPSIEYDIIKEFGKPEPDGPNARFRPSEWIITDCEKGQGPIEVSPEFKESMPKKPWYLF